MVKRLTAEEIRDLVKLSDITDAEIEAWYNEHQEEYDKPAQVRASHILLPDEAAAKELLARIQAAISKEPNQARGVFEDFARKHSTDKDTKDRGGDLQFFGEPGVSQAKRGPLAPPLVPAVQKAAFGLAGVGDIHPEPIQSSAGWHLVQKTGFRRPYRRKLEDVRNSIRNKLFRAKKGSAMEDYVKALRTKAKVKIDEGVLAEAKVEPGGPPPPSLDPANLMRPGGTLPLPKPRQR
jgi:peptidyl-prolyl cis-trans isomerase C